MIDKIYSIYNHYFIFNITHLEFLKLSFIILLISIIENKKTRISIFVVLLFVSLLQFIHFSYFGKNISAIEFYLFFNNIEETFNTLGSMLELIFIPLFIVLGAFLIVYFIDNNLEKKIFTNKYAIYICIFMFSYLVFKIYYITNIKINKLIHNDSKYIYPVVNRHSMRNFFVSMDYFIVSILPKKIFGYKSEFSILQKPELINKNQKRTIILIIGESLRYDKFSNNSIFTPNLNKLRKTNSNLLFKKVFSGGTMTKVSIAVLLNRLKYPQSLEQIIKENNCIFKLAKQNNKNTYFITAQRDTQIELLYNVMCPKYIDKIITRDDFNNYINPVGYDEDLLDIFKKLNLLNQNSLIVLQQRGSHSPYFKQYPKLNNKYTSYENTVLYTDKIISNLFNYINKNSIEETFVFFVSDHGELLGENGKKGHGHLNKYVYEVPFLFYTNSKNNNIKNLFDNIHSQYDISKTIIKLLGYNIKEKDNTKKLVYIMNSDLDGFSGFKRIKIKDE